MKWNDFCRSFHNISALKEGMLKNYIKIAVRNLRRQKDFFGLTSFIIECRTKEIGIRKVLGAGLIPNI